MAGISGISVTDNIAYDFFSKMAKKNNCKYRQIQMSNGLTGNFLMNNTTLDCFLTRDSKIVGGQGFRTSEAANYAKNMLKTVSKLPASVAEKFMILSILKNVH